LKVIAKVPISNTEDVKTAIDAASDAYPAWRKTPPITRARYFFKLKELLEKNLKKSAEYVHRSMVKLSMSPVERFEEA